MNATEHPTPTELRVGASARKPIAKRALHLLRRGHLYLGLFLFPWAILYGVTGFLFNHPTAFSDQAATNFSSSALIGTPLETRMTCDEAAAEVVRLVNEKQKPEVPYAVAGSARYGREFAFGTVKTQSGNLSFLIDVKHGGGTIRNAPPAAPKPEQSEPAPFSVGEKPRAQPIERGTKTETSAGADRGDHLIFEHPLHERIKQSMPAIIAASNFTSGEVTITSVPDVIFPIAAGDKTWTATYNPMTGILSGKPTDAAPAAPPAEISVRKFLLRLHTAHGYPGDQNARWFWAVIVDAMSFVMCFWGFTGILMWRQIKATRSAGTIVLILSAACALALGYAMYGAIRAA